MHFILDFGLIIVSVLVFLFLLLYGSLGFFPQKNNMLRILFIFELMILLASFLFVIIGIHYFDIYGQVVVMFLLTIAAVEASIGLALIYIYYRYKGNIQLDSLDKLKV